VNRVAGELCAGFFHGPRATSIGIEALFYEDMSLLIAYGLEAGLIEVMCVHEPKLRCCGAEKLMSDGQHPLGQDSCRVSVIPQRVPQGAKSGR
jgi:hypothetical protein